MLDGGGAELLQNSLAEDDTGGSVTLETSSDGGLTWDFFGTENWQDIKNWGLVGDFFGSLVRAYETGNGTTYTGRTYSNTLDFGP